MRSFLSTGSFPSIRVLIAPHIAFLLILVYAVLLRYFKGYFEAAIQIVISLESAGSASLLQVGATITFPDSNW